MTSPRPNLLVLTPVKDAVPHLPTYFANLHALDYPPELLSLGILESDSTDGTFEALAAPLEQLGAVWRRARRWKKDFGYRLPPDLPRWAHTVQLMRRSVLARSRNHLLFRALDDVDWVLWLDVDVVEYPPDILLRLLAHGRSILTPNCVTASGGPSFDRNAWRGPDHRVLSELRDEGELVELDTVGGTMLLIRADLHRDGLVFPAFPYGRANPRARPDMAELETEGLGLMAHDMGHRCWGLPHLEIRHSPD